MRRPRITIRLLGNAADEGHVRLAAFIKQLEAVQEALNYTELLASGGASPSVYYRVVDLSHNSPATIVLEPAVRNGKPSKSDAVDLSRKTVNRLVENLQLIRKNAPLADDVDVRTLESYRNLGRQLGETLHSVKLSAARATISIDDKFNHHIEEIIGPDEVSPGSVSGMLEQINLHNKHVFTIYPSVGPKSLRCDFPEHLMTEVVSAIKRHVRVHGDLRYKSRDRFAYAIRVKSFEVLPDDDSLPSLASLWGIAPGATGGLSSEEFISRIRNDQP